MYSMFGSCFLSLSSLARVTIACNYELCLVAFVSVRCLHFNMCRLTTVISAVVVVTSPLPAIHSLTRDCRLGSQKRALTITAEVRPESDLSQRVIFSLSCCRMLSVILFVILCKPCVLLLVADDEQSCLALQVSHVSTRGHVY